MSTPQPIDTPWPRVAIAGAGLSGLCLAHGLLAAGFDVQVYERDAAPDARRQGYRITLDKHGAAALRRCLPPRLFAAVLATASTPGPVGYFYFANRHLGKIFRLTFTQPAGEAREVIGQVDRATLRAIMFSGLEGRVHFGRPAAGVETTAGGPALRLADGTLAEAEVVVAADGIHSPLRRQLLPDCPIVDTGSRAIYGKTPLPAAGPPLIPAPLENAGLMAIADAPGRFFFCTSMRFDNPPASVFARDVPGQAAPVLGDYVMWALVLPRVEAPAGLLDLDAPALHALAIEAARDYHPLLQRFVAEADAAYTVATPVSAATRPTRWPASRATLIGDAVHVMPPTGAHGGNTALRDAALLAERLTQAAASGQPLEAAIDAYQQEMLAYAFAEVANSMAMLRRGNVTNPVLRWFMLRALPALQRPIV